MKKIFFTVLFLSSMYAFSQVVVETTKQTPQPSQKTMVVVQKPAFTPHLRLNIFTLYAFDDQVESDYSSTYYFSGEIKGGFEWGGALEYMIAQTQSIEFSYLRLDSKANITAYSAISEPYHLNVASNYILIGSNRYFGMNPKVEPYAGLNLGMVVFSVDNPDTGKNGSDTKFAWGAKLGLNYWVSEKVGIKIQAGLLSAVQGAGGGLYFGTGGAGAGVSTYSTFYQFNIGGGLTFKLGKNL